MLPNSAVADAKMIIIADTHVDKAEGNDRLFFQMLLALEENNEDIVFLGDIFDLWIALPRYEDDLHRQFLAWCRAQRNHRTIGFIEGNHEFYVAEERKNHFSWCSDGPSWSDGQGILFTHGDQVNPQDKNYIRFRRLTKNKITKTLMRHLPFGPQLVAPLKRSLKKTNREFRLHLPLQEIKAFADAKFSDNFNAIFVAHFHQEYRYCNLDDQALYVLPDWSSTQKLTIYNRKSRQLTSASWETLDRVLRA